jgi:hypothetical protein
MFFGNFVPKKPENKREGISPNYNNPHKGYALPGAKRFLSGSLGFLFFLLLSPGAILKFSVVAEADHTVYQSASTFRMTQFRSWSARR